MEHEPERRSEFGEPGAVAASRAADDGAGLAGVAEEGAGLHRLHPADGVFAQSLVLRRKVEHLAADHSADTGSGCELPDQFYSDTCVGIGSRVGEDREGERQQRIAGEDRGRLVVGLVHGRLAAAHVVVVHRRQVVVDEAVAMHAFQCRGSADDARAGRAKHPRRLDQQERPEPLAGTEGGVAHGGKQPRRPLAFAGARRCRQERVERGICRGGGRGEPPVEILSHPSRMVRKPPMVKAAADCTR